MSIYWQFDWIPVRLQFEQSHGRWQFLSSYQWNLYLLSQKHFQKTSRPHSHSSYDYICSVCHERIEFVNGQIGQEVTTCLLLRIWVLLYLSRILWSQYVLQHMTSTYCITHLSVGTSSLTLIRTTSKNSRPKGPPWISVFHNQNREYHQHSSHRLKPGEIQTNRKIPRDSYGDMLHKGQQWDHPKA